MYRKIFIYTSGLLLVVAGTLFLLFHFSSLPNLQKNGFKREYLGNSITELYKKSLNIDLTRISGRSNSRIYLSGLSPSWVIAVDPTFQVVDTFYLNIMRSEMFLAPNTFVDSPNIYMYAGNISYLVRGKIGKFNIDTLKLKTPVFLRTAQISPRLLLIRGFDSSQTRQVFKLIDCFDGSIITEAQIVEDDAGYGFASDGHLLYDSATKKVIYLQSHTNQFVCLDTNLNILYRGNTIDTVNKMNLSLKTQKADKNFKIMPAQSRSEVNSSATVCNGLLFVISALKADNESEYNFQNNFPIDIYDLRNGRYLKSFYIPKLSGKKASSILVANGTITVLFPKGNIFSYNTPYFIDSLLSKI